MTTTNIESKVPIETIEEAVIRFAGDSGDGMQLTGSEFTSNTALFGNDLATFPDFPAEIRAPAGTIPGVSAFQIRFATHDVFTPGSQPDVLVAMNPAALQVHLKDLKKGGVLIVNSAAFEKRLSLEQAGWKTNPLEDEALLRDYRLIQVDLNKLTRDTLENSPLDARARMRCKNFAALGILYWIYCRDMQSTVNGLNAKFGKKAPDVAAANIAVLQAGYNYAETVELLDHHFRVEKAKLPPGKYRNIMGNQAVALGLVAAAKLAKVDLFYGTYPITPASDILHYLARNKSEGVITFQAEDEIAAIASAIGASFGGALGVTASSGPGIALKGEALGLAVMTELPLVVINVQRGGPSTGLPTKTEQADLLQAVWGRNGECPMPVVAAATAADCFAMTIEAARIAIKYMTPVMLLTDGYIANCSEPWLLPKASDLPDISRPYRTQVEGFQPYLRNPQTLAREWAIPGTPGLRHRIGGLEKQDITGNVSYDADNHFHMVRTRAAKVQAIADDMPEPEFAGDASGDILIVGWGSTLGAIHSAFDIVRKSGRKVSYLHLRHVWPLPKSLAATFARFKRVLVPEMNLGQLHKILACHIPADYVPMHKVNGRPFYSEEIVTRIEELLK